MKKKALFVPLFGFMLLMLSSCGSKGQAEQSVAKGDTGVVTKDLQLWNCDYSLFEKAKKVIVYRLNPVSEPTASDMTIAKIKVADEGTLLDQKQQNVLKFLVSSPLNYNDKSDDYRKLFSPYFAYEFQAGEKSLFLLVDISSDEWAVASREEILQQRLTKSRNALVQLGHDIFPDDQYVQSIINNIKENEK